MQSNFLKRLLSAVLACLFTLLSFAPALNATAQAQTVWTNRLSFLVPTADLAALRTAINSATGVSADSSASFPQKTIDGTAYYYGTMPATDAILTAMKTFLDADANRIYVERAHDNVIIRGSSTAEDLYVGTTVPIERIAEDLANRDALGTVMADSWARWKEHITTSGTWQYPYPSGNPPAAFSTQSGWVYNNAVFRNNTTEPGFLSEGQSFGMMLAAVNGDSATFFSIWNRTKFGLQGIYGTKLLYFARYVSDNQPSYGATAPDGELGVIIGLLMAHERGWNSDAYKTRALEIADDVRAHMVAEHAGRYVFCGGSDLDSVNWCKDPVEGSLAFTNYQMIYAFRMLAKHDTANTAYWEKLIVDSLYFLDENAKLFVHGLPGETYRVRPDGTVEQSELSDARKRHYYGTGRVFIFIVWDALMGGQESIDWLENSPSAKVYRDYYLENGGLPWSWEQDGSIDFGSNSPAMASHYMAVESVFNPAFAKRVFDLVQLDYLGDKWKFNEDNNFMQFIIMMNMALYGRYLTAVPDDNVIALDDYRVAKAEKLKGAA